MFVLTDDYTYLWPVKVAVPTSGEHKTQEFEARFRLVSTERAKELFGDIAAVPSGERLDAFLREALVGWTGVSGESGGELAFTEENRDRLIGIPYVCAALSEAYGESISGRAEKN